MRLPVFIFLLFIFFLVCHLCFFFFLCSGRTPGRPKGIVGLAIYIFYNIFCRHRVYLYMYYFMCYLFSCQCFLYLSVTYLFSGPLYNYTCACVPWFTRKRIFWFVYCYFFKTITSSKGFSI